MTHTTEGPRSAAPQGRAPANITRGAAHVHPARRLLQWLPELMLVLLAAMGVIFLFNLWWSIPVSVRPGGPLGQAMDQLSARGILPWLGLPLLMATTLVGARRLRWRINHTYAFWKDVCPRCGDPDLQRIPRKPYERRIANLGIPVRRYYCVSCRWRGTRIDGTLVHD